MTAFLPERGGKEMKEKEEKRRRKGIKHRKERERGR